MPKSNYDPVELIKRAALAAVVASNPVNVLFGTVTSSSPIEINIDQKFPLDEQELILTRNVTDYTVSMTVDHQTETAEGGSGETAFASHYHGYKGEKEYIVHNGLKAGEKVILIRMQGGQKYLVLDRLGGLL